MNQFQSQTKIVEQEGSYIFNKYMICINDALRHTNPQVRKQAEALFKVLYLEFGENLISRLDN